MNQAGAALRRESFDVTNTGMLKGASADPCVMVIFGAGGDLTRRDLLPSVFELHRKQLLPATFAVIGFSRSPWGSDRFRQEMRTAVMEHCENCAGGPAHWDDLARRLSFVSGDAESDPDDDYAALAREIARVQTEFGIEDNVFFHLAVPPGLFGTIASRLGASGLARSDAGWRRLVVEKPFGENRESAHQLDRQLRAIFDEEQIYRIDHFLGKESVQNMLVFRFANPGFEPIWNRNYIDHVQITVAESLGIGSRGGFYDAIGVVRDMVQNHLLHLLCLTAMEPPARYAAASLRAETLKVLDAIAPINVRTDCVVGQYGSGRIADEQVRAYREEESVAEDSTTSTFAALKLLINNWRWAGVPFYLRTGKRMSQKVAEVTVCFKPTPHMMFPLDQETGALSNILTFRLQPDEGILQTFLAKQPGAEICLRPVTMHFGYDSAFGVEHPPSAYQWLLLDAMHGNQTLFPHAEWISKAWSLLDPVVAAAESHGTTTFPNYAAGSWGPAEATALLQREGREWIVL